MSDTLYQKLTHPRMSAAPIACPAPLQINTPVSRFRAIIVPSQLNPAFPSPGNCTCLPRHAGPLNGGALSNSSGSPIFARSTTSRPGHAGITTRISDGRREDTHLSEPWLPARHGPRDGLFYDLQKLIPLTHIGGKALHFGRFPTALHHCNPGRLRRPRPLWHNVPVYPSNPLRLGRGQGRCRFMQL